MEMGPSTRRSFLKVSGGSLLGAGLASLPYLSADVASGATLTATELESPFVTSSEALRKLLQGNLRFQYGNVIRPDLATIFSCVDSRVPPEMIFDQGLGDLFVIRTAAHVLDNAALGSLEFGVAELHIPLLMILGHERCGAVTATINAIDNKEEAPGSIQTLVDYIRPAVLAAQGTGANRLDSAVRNNSRRTLQELLRSKILKNAVVGGQLRIVAARYNLDTGAVTLL